MDIVNFFLDALVNEKAISFVLTTTPCLIRRSCNYPSGSKNCLGLGQNSNHIIPLKLQIKDGKNPGRTLLPQSRHGKICDYRNTRCQR